MEWRKENFLTLSHNQMGEGWIEVHPLEHRPYEENLSESQTPAQTRQLRIIPLNVSNLFLGQTCCYLGRERLDQ